MATTQITQKKIRFKECTRRLQELLAYEKTVCLKNYLENLDATPASNYSLWRAARKLKTPVEYRPPLRTSTGGWARSDTEKGNIFVEHLKSVFTQNTCSGIVDLPSVVALPPRPIN